MKLKASIWDPKSTSHLSFMQFGLKIKLGGGP